MGYVKGSVSASEVLSGIPTWSWNAKDNDPVFVDITGTWQIEAPPFGIEFRLNNEGVAANQNDEVELGIVRFPKAASYTMYLTVYKGTSEGIAHPMLDGVDVGGLFDLYDGSGVNIVTLSASLGAQAVGIKLIGLKVASKNASSGGYRLNIYSVIIVPTL